MDWRSFFEFDRMGERCSRRRGADFADQCARSASDELEDRAEIRADLGFRLCCDDAADPGDKLIERRSPVRWI